jgi:hypothetical protein
VNPAIENVRNTIPQQTAQHKIPPVTSDLSITVCDVKPLPKKLPFHIMPLDTDSQLALKKISMTEVMVTDKVFDANSTADKLLKRSECTKEFSWYHGAVFKPVVEQIPDDEQLRCRWSNCFQQCNEQLFSLARLFALSVSQMHIGKEIHHRLIQPECEL